MCSGRAKLANIRRAYTAQKYVNASRYIPNACCIHTISPNICANSAHSNWYTVAIVHGGLWYMYIYNICAQSIVDCVCPEHCAAQARARARGKPLNEWHLKSNRAISAALIEVEVFRSPPVDSSQVPTSHHHHHPAAAATSLCPFGPFEHSALSIRMVMLSRRAQIRVDSREIRMNHAIYV